ncbi:hypothetical protein ACIO3O_33055 [Streptomyces sp. NPDC087440]|uniref:hypothetical protein n=1 Tax=Streptomyces sp. NPDC087440 TaxID=3365790 RepID=UPI00380ED095
MTKPLRLLALLLTAATLSATGPASASSGVESDLAHHGRVVYEDDGRLDLHLRTWNHGPASLASGTVQLTFSTAVTGPLPTACARRTPTVLLCETGPLRAGTPSPTPLHLTLRVPNTPDELWLDIQTARPTATRDLNPANDHQHVLALSTGDPYYF